MFCLINELFILKLLSVAQMAPTAHGFLFILKLLYVVKIASIINYMQILGSRPFGSLLIITSLCLRSYIQLIEENNDYNLFNIREEIQVLSKLQNFQYPIFSHVFLVKV